MPTMSESKKEGGMLSCSKSSWRMIWSITLDQLLNFLQAVEVDRRKSFCLGCNQGPKHRNNSSASNYKKVRRVTIAPILLGTGFPLISILETRETMGLPAKLKPTDTNKKSQQVSEECKESKNTVKLLECL